MKRKGFTLIELMVVIAIIIILAAIAIPNYLSMTARAKKSRVASDFAALATALETYRSDWNRYPTSTLNGAIVITDATGKATSIGLLGHELAGDPGTEYNHSGNTTAAGDNAPIQYMTPTILQSMVNPYSTVTANQYTYAGDANGTTWTLTALTGDSKTGNPKSYSRSDTTTNLSEVLN